MLFVPFSGTLRHDGEGVREPLLFVDGLVAPIHGWFVVAFAYIMFRVVCGDSRPPRGVFFGPICGL